MDIIHLPERIHTNLNQLLNEKGIDLSNIEFIIDMEHPITHEEQMEMENVAKRLGNKENHQVLKFEYVELEPFIELDPFEDPLPPKHTTYVIFQESRNITYKNERLNIVYKPRNSRKTFPIFTISKNTEFLLHCSGDSADLSEINRNLLDVANRLMGNGRTSLCFNYCSNEEISTQYYFILKS